MVEIQRGYRNPVTGYPDYRYRGNEFTGQAPWVNEEHDSDLDGVPNYLDSDPLNPNVQYIPAAQHVPYEKYGTEEVPQETIVPKVRKSRKKSKRKKGKKK